jgi:transcriptional regulator of acetoin/glycerol metabolism
MQRMKTYHWPGNVRELCNVIEHFYISNTGTRFKFDLQNLGSRNNTVRPHTLAENEKAYILKALQECKWKVSGKGSASEYLGLNESTLRSRMRKMKIERKKS